MSWYWDHVNFVQVDIAETKSVRPTLDLWVLDTQPETDQCDLDINIQYDMQSTTATVAAAAVTTAFALCLTSLLFRINPG